MNFIFSSVVPANPYGGAISYGINHTITIDANTPAQGVTYCFGAANYYGPISDPVSSQTYYCVNNKTCSPCDANSYNVNYFQEPNGYLCLEFSYNCNANNFPQNISVPITVNLNWYAYDPQSSPPFTLQNETVVLTFDKDHVSNRICRPTHSLGGNYAVGSCTTTGVPSCCPPPIDQKINPYYTGLKGNWRGKQSYVYTTNRNPKLDPANTATLPTNTRKGGVFNAFTSFYKVENGKFVAKYQTDNKWIASATVTKVNSKGQEVENKDALNKYSSAQFGFNELVTTAVASNARNNEMGYDGFEDYTYSNACNLTANSDLCSEDGHFNFKQALRLANGAGINLITREAHTGNYSLMVNGVQKMHLQEGN